MGLIQRHGLWEIRYGESTSFLCDTWRKLPYMVDREYIQDLNLYIQRSPLERVQDFWEPMQEDMQFHVWKPKTQWQSCVPEDNLDNFYEELCARRIPKVDGPEKGHQGYSNTGNFSITKAVGLLTKTQRMSKEEKWSKVWKGNLWPKIATFNWLLLHR